MEIAVIKIRLANLFFVQALLVLNGAVLADTEAPELISISLDRTSVDVSQGEPQRIEFTIEATDATGINWGAGPNKTNVVLARPAGNAQIGSLANSAYKYALSSEDKPGKFSVDFNQSDFTGDWSINFAQLQDDLGNKNTYSLNSLVSVGLESDVVTVVGGVEAEIPILETISVDIVSLDVSNGPQPVTFVISATDQSGIVWDAGSNNTDVVLRGPDSSYRYALSSNESPGNFTIDFVPDDPKGIWTVLFADLKDSVGNRGLYPENFLISKGLVINKLFVFDDQTQTSSLAASVREQETSLVQNKPSVVLIDLRNEGTDEIQNVEFVFRSENLSIDQVKLDGTGAIACSISNINSSATGSCAISSLSAGESKSISVVVIPGSAGSANFSGFGLPNGLERTFSDNAFKVEYSVAADETPPIITLVGDQIVAHAQGADYSDAGATAMDDVDGDITESITVTGNVDVNTIGQYTITYSVSDSAGNAAEAVTRSIYIEVDTDGDSAPNSIDTDDDGDDVPDEDDAFPLDATESVDTDGDNIGDNADTDDDGDGIADEDDAFPLVSLDGREDTDGDGYPDDCDLICNEAGMIADQDDDNDGIVDNADNCVLTPNAEQLNTDGDAEGNVCDLDDDNDGFTDEEELADGTNPLSRFSCRSGCFSFDIDQDEQAKALTDGLLVIRHLFGFSGDTLITGATSGSGQRTSPEAITGLLDDASSELDIDGDGEEKALSDGLLLIRYLFGFTGESLTTGAIGSGASRTTSEEIEAYISERIPAQD